MRNEGPHPCAPEDIATPSQVIVVGNNTSPDVLGVSTKVSEDLPLIEGCEAETSARPKLLKSVSIVKAAQGGAQRMIAARDQSQRRHEGVIELH